jgi:alanyl-tRNA synthetase
MERARRARKPGPARARRPPRPLVRLASASAPPSSSATTPRGRGPIVAMVVDGKEVEEAEAGDEVASCQPDAVLRRIRRPGGRHGAIIRPARRRIVEVSDTQKKLGDLHVHMGKSRQGSLRSATPSLRVDGRAPRPRSAPTIRRRTCCTRRCAGGWASTSRRRARWSRPTGCASTSPSQAADRRGHRRGRGRGERRIRRTPRSSPADDARRGGRGRRAGAVRREVRRRGARALDGPAAPAKGEQARYSVELCGGTHVRAPATSAVQDRVRGARGRRRAPHRGGDRRGGAPVAGRAQERCCATPRRP